MNTARYLMLGCLIWSLSSVPLLAQSAGQAKLDEATDKKIDAESPDDLAKVIELCEEAIDLGLDELDLQLAKDLLSSSALRRAEMSVQRLPRVANNRRALENLRRNTVEDLEKAIENNPKLADAFLLLAKLETLPGGDSESALENLNKAIELMADRPVDQAQAFMLRAVMRTDNEEKLQDLAKAIEADPTNPQAWQARITLQMSMGKLQEAVEDAEKLLEKDDSDMFAFQSAIQSLLGLEKTDEAIAMLSKRIEKDPENNAFYRVRARAYMLQDDLEKSLLDLDKAIEIEKRDYESLIMRAQIRLSNDEIDKAKRDVNDALLVQPGYIPGILFQSMIAAVEERYGDAIADMERLVREFPGNDEWIMRLASYYQMDERPRRAVQLLDELIRRSPDAWRAFRLRGDAKLAISEHLDAVDDYEEALRVLEVSREGEEDTTDSDLDYSGLLNNLSWVLATSPIDELRNGDQALELGLKACEVTEYKEAHILSTLAAAYAETGDFENARKWAAKAVELGETEDHEQLEQLKLELDSYEQDKPWREEQQTEENEKPVISASETIDT